MPRHWKFGVTFLVCLNVSLFAESLVPLATAYLDCVRDDEGLSVGSRRLRTPMFISKRGARAFGLVAAELAPQGWCRNTTKLYVSEHNKPFRLVFQQKAERIPDGSTYDGNGVEAIRWSPSGSRLLVEISQWIWASDDGGDTKHILFTPGHRAAKVIFPVDAVWKKFKRPCTAIIEPTGWIDDERIGLTASPFASTDEEGIPDKTPSCLQKPMEFSFNVIRATLEQLFAADKD